MLRLKGNFLGYTVPVPNVYVTKYPDPSVSLLF